MIFLERDSELLLTYSWSVLVSTSQFIVMALLLLYYTKLQKSGNAERKRCLVYFLEFKGITIQNMFITSSDISIPCLFLIHTKSVGWKKRADVQD